MDEVADGPDDSKISDEEIDASFGFFDPSDKDFHSLNELLKQQFKDIEELTVPELTETIIRQAGS